MHVPHVWGKVVSTVGNVFGHGHGHAAVFMDFDPVRVAKVCRRFSAFRELEIPRIPPLSDFRVVLPVLGLPNL